MPTLTWIGKEKVVNHHLEVPYRVLEHRYGYRADNAEDKSFTGSGNMIIHGDNLEALKALLPEYEGRVKCIYIDPPYNTGNEGWVYNDNVNHPKIQKWLGEVVGKQEEDFTRHDKWLCMMYPRLRLLQRLLSEDGAIFISIDDNEQAHLKMVCDEIFGVRNFVAQFIWQKRKGGGNDSSFVATDHEYILAYIKRKELQEKWRIDYDEEYLKRYKFEDEIGKYYYDTLSRPGLNNPIIYDVVCPDGSIIKDGTWQISKATFEKELSDGNVDFIKNKQGGYTVVKKVRIPNEGKVIRSILTNSTNKNSADEMGAIFGNKKEFSTPKPVELLKSMLDLVADPNSIILDSFAGSGTTAHAVLNLNKKDGGNRKFILVEMEDYADSITAERVRRVINGYADTEGTGGCFDFYELGDTLFNADGTLNETVGEDRIREYIYYTETKQHLSRKREAANCYLLDTWNGVAYYFYYERGKETTLTYDKLSIIKQKAERYIVYADTCTIDKDYLNEKSIIFKKIPRDIQKF